MKNTAYIIIALLFTIMLSCKKVYTPQLASVSTNFLAVDGPIISGDSTFIRLSRTTSLSDTTQNKAELKASIFIDNDQNVLYPLTEKGKGLYTLGVTNFNADRKYRLNIKTSNGKLYQSEFVPMKVTPPIDSVYFKQNSDATIQFYVNTHDATNKTRYYRWDYKETWPYLSLFRMASQYKNGEVSFLRYNIDEDISRCYRTALSNQVLVGSSAKLAQDVINEQPLGGLVSNSEKIPYGYVMQLKQYALTEDGFNYYNSVKNNTENLGSIFDAQPSLTKGNIHCITTPNEVVIGFISVSTVAAKQYNLRYSDIPLKVPNLYGNIEWALNHFYNNYYFGTPDPGSCMPQSISQLPTANLQSRLSQVLANGEYIVFDSDQILFTPYFIYYYAPKTCVDCRLKGGTTTKPSYFPF